MSNTPEEQAEQLLTDEGYVILPPAELPVAPPALPVPALTPVGQSVRLWKPRHEEFFESEFDDLFAQLQPTLLVCYEIEDEVKGGVDGHSLVCTVCK